MAREHTGLVIAAHGSLLDPDSAQPAYRHATELRERGEFGTVRETYWKEEPAFRDVLVTLDCETVYVVPLFMSEGYFVDRILPRELDIRPHSCDEVTITPPVGTHSMMQEVVLHRVRSVTGEANIGTETGLAIIGHGTERHAASDASTRMHVEAIRQMGQFTEVKALFLDEPPYVANLTDHFDASRIVVVPFFVADGYHTNTDIPDEIGLERVPSGDIARRSRVDGRDIWYAGAIGTDPRMADVILERAVDAGARLEPPVSTHSDGRPHLPDSIDLLLSSPMPIQVDGMHLRRTGEVYEVTFEGEGTQRVPADDVSELLAEHPRYVSNWYFWERVATDIITSERSYLRWLEFAEEQGPPTRYDGQHERTWGEITIHTNISPRGERRYSLRHREDHESTGLKMIADPAEAFDIARLDSAGRHRPLKSIPTLVTGWRMEDLGHHGLLKAMSYFYPASIADWHRSRSSGMDLTHWRETAARQTGIHDVVSDLSREEVQRATKVCCTDETCLKRRMWDYDTGDPIETARGDGPIPCPGPCAFFLSAAKEWREIPDESSKSDEIEAMADERESIPEADFEHSANRFRRHYIELNDEVDSER